MDERPTGAGVGTDEEIIDVFRRRPLYVALFDSSLDFSVPSEPLVSGQGTHPVTHLHGIDREAARALPSLWYFLHLPRTFYELVDLPVSAGRQSAAWHLDHTVMLAPIEAFADQDLGEWPPPGLKPALIGVPDDLLDDASVIADERRFLLPPIRHSDMSTTTVEDHWMRLHSHLPTKLDFIGRTPSLTNRLESRAVRTPGSSAGATAGRGRRCRVDRRPDAVAP